MRDLTELQYLALTIWGEARNQSRNGMEYVGSVILNRKKKAPSIKAVVTAPGQFSVWNKQNPNYRKMITVETLPQHSKDYLAYQKAKEVARHLLETGPKIKAVNFKQQNGQNAFR